MNLASAYLSRPSTQRILRRKPGQEGFSLIELVVVIAVLAVLIVVALPNFQGVTDDAAVAAGKKFLVDGLAECKVLLTRDPSGAPQITPPTINGGTFAPNVKTACPKASGAQALKFTPSLGSIPEFEIDLYSGVKKCTVRDATAAPYGCVSGTW